MASGTGQTSRVDALTQAIAKARGFEFELEDAYLKDVSDDVLLLTDVDIYDKLRDLAILPLIHFSGGVESNGDKYFNLYFMVL